MPNDSDQQEAREDLERSRPYRDQGASMRKADSMSSSITKEDFVAARNVAYGCLSAVKELSVASYNNLASGHIATLIYKPSLFVCADFALTPAEEKSSRLARAVKHLCKVLDYAGPKVELKPLRLTDWTDSYVPDKIAKVKDWLLLVSSGQEPLPHSTAHEKYYWWALDLWTDIEFCIFRQSFEEGGSYERGPRFDLELERIEDNDEEICERIREKKLFDRKYEEAKASVEKESARALAAWRVEAGLASAQRKPEAVESAIAGQPTEGNLPRPKATVNSRILELIQKEPKARGWTCQQWAERLKCGKSTVAETDT